MLTATPRQRVDPNRLYWMRNEHAPAMEDVSEVSSLSGSGSGSGSGSAISQSSGSGSSSSRTRGAVPRPPSYSSDDGVSYVVDARPRSMAPQSTLGGSSHRSEGGRSGPWI